MRILAYSHNFFPTLGGVASYCRDLCTELCTDNELLTLLAPAYEGVSDLAFPVFTMPSEMAHDQITLFGYLRAARYLTMAIDKLKPDVLWCCSLDALYVVAFTNTKTTALTVTLHGSEISQNFGKQQILKRIRACLIQRALLKAHRVVVVSNYTKELVIRYLPELESRIDVVHNGVTLPANFAIKSPQFRKKILDNELVLLSVGRLVEGKGFHLFPETLSQIIKLFPNLKWRIAGDGDFRKIIEQAVKYSGMQDHVEFLGWVKPEKLSALYQNAVLLIHPAITDSQGRSESFGLILIEAMLNGCPVASTGIGGTGEIIEDGKSGILFDVAKPVSASKALVKYLNNKNMLEQVGISGQRLVFQTYTLDKCTKNTLLSLKKAVKEFNLQREHE